MKFTSVIFDPSQNEIARVNRLTGVLYLKPQIWDHLPQAEKNFVLLHEEGHVILQTADEFTANRYAISHFAPVQTLSNRELGQRIVVMRDILTPGKENQISGFSGGIDPVSNVAGAIGSIFESLPMLGIGSKSRQTEIAAQAAAQQQIIAAQEKAAQEKSNQTLVIASVGGAILVVLVVIYFIFKK